MLYYPGDFKYFVKIFGKLAAAFFGVVVPWVYGWAKIVLWVLGK